MPSLDPYELLGVPRGASQDEITKAWRGMVKIFHPDAHPEASPAEKLQWEAAVQRLNEAHDQLAKNNGERSTSASTSRPSSAKQEPSARSSARDETPNETRRMRIPGVGECMMCGYAPAIPVHFTSLSGRVFRYHVRDYDGWLCKSCGRALGRSYQNVTLGSGWFGVISALRTLVTIPQNTMSLVRLSRLPKHSERRDDVSPLITAPLNPGKPVFKRFGIWVAAVLVGALVTAVIVTDTKNSSSFDSSLRVGACVAGTTRVHVVECGTSGVTGRIIVKVTRSDACPSYALSYVQDGADVWCIQG